MVFFYARNESKTKMPQAKYARTQFAVLFDAAQMVKLI